MAEMIVGSNNLALTAVQLDIRHRDLVVEISLYAEPTGMRNFGLTVPRLVFKYAENVTTLLDGVEVC